ncbi:hypothetical protein K469DRAFT_633209 [Zopfia rhizophila CBS 207.26]|uniref:Uncharacterized protein n=1 Tax=Zopfia rhizophila CBS 207.26 TaxID=1314779 RepID=A0A6A6DYY5_9PEZI|nr:hypothetical protein K469DRAFT_633209 [Zopfia rhizophila CBS 207.26]
MEGGRPLDYIDYYRVTFDHLVPADDPDPEVLLISIIVVDNDGGAFANRALSFPLDPTEYTGKKQLTLIRLLYGDEDGMFRGRRRGIRRRRFVLCCGELGVICRRRDVVFLGRDDALSAG